MKRIKKLASILLAMIMVLGMGITAFASGATAPTDGTTDPSNTKIGEGNFKLTISDTTEGYTYAIYQIFKGDLSKDGDTKTLSNIEWGASVDLAKVAETFTKKDADGNDVAMSASEVAASISGETNAFDTKAATEFAAKIAKCITGATVDATTGKVTLPAASYKDATFDAKGYTFSELDAGYYMVANTDVPEVDGDYTRYMMEIIGDVTATPKRGTLEHDKDIVVKKPDGTEGVDYVKVNDAPIGGTVDYSIPVTLPANFADYETYYLEFSDTLTKGLTVDMGSVKVMAGDVDVTKYFYKNATKITEGEYKDGTAITVSISDLKGLNNVEVDGQPVTITAATEIVLTYSATLNENAVIGIEGNPNYVKIVHSNDPNNSGDGPTTPPENPNEPKPTHPTGETPKKDVVTYTTELAILKTNEKNEVLPGTEFELSGEGVLISYVTKEEFVEDENGAYWKLKNGSYTLTAPTEADDETDNTADYESTTQKYKLVRTITPKEDATATVKTEVAADGRVVFTGLGQGTYTLKETKTLAGYNTIEDITFTISFDPETKKFSTNSDIISVGQNNTLQAGIVNQSGSLLPSTGGIGTTIFYVVGGILVIGAGILLVAKKRMNAK